MKYTDEGGHIDVYMEEKLSSESGVGCFEFVVEDDGIGMIPEFLDKLFLPFERAEDSRVSRIQGTGLGMPITRNLVQMMNGRIQATFAPGTYDLILMDIQMPVLDGYGAARAIRRLGMTKERPDAETIPIIALTANAFADDAYQAKQAGMDGHVTKPLEINKLLEVIHQWVD